MKMRCNQVSINIERFGKYVPKNYLADVQRIHVYCDDYNSIYAALSKAYALAINELAEYENIGARTDVYTNEFSKADYREMHGALPETKRKYEEDVNLEYYDSDIELCKDRIWVYEHALEILEILKECTDKDMLSTLLKDRFKLDDYQIRKLSQMRFDMMTKEEYLETIEKMSKLQKLHLKSDAENRTTEYRKSKAAKVQCEIKKLNSYFKFLDSYEQITKLALTANSPKELEETLRKEFGFEWDEASAFKYYSLSDFTPEKQKEKREQLKRLKEDLEYYSKEK